MIAALLLSALTLPAPDCSLQHLAACHSANDLAWDRGFARALNRFSGDVRTDLIEPDQKLGDLALDLVSGPPDDPMRLANGDTLFTGCPAHYCYRGGAVVVSPAGEIVAIAVLAPRWAGRLDGKPDEFSDATLLLLQDEAAPKPVAHWYLDIYVRTASPDAPAWNGKIAGWGKSEYDASEAVYAKYESSADLTGRVWLIAPGSKTATLLRTVQLR